MACLSPVAEIEEAHAGLTEVGFEANPKTAVDTVLKVAREDRYHPLQRYFEDLEHDESIRALDPSIFSADYFGSSDPLLTRCGLRFCVALSGGYLNQDVHSTLF